MPGKDRKKYVKPELTKLEPLSRMTMIFELQADCTSCWSDVRNQLTCTLCGQDIRIGGGCAVCWNPFFGFC
ncbi:hypothetical protein ACFL2Q_19055 [Thermodesulfobacteriota bacterium]